MRARGAALGILAGGALLLGLAGGAGAHTDLEASDPAEGSTVANPPGAIDLSFAGPTMLAGTRVVIEGPGDSSQPPPRLELVGSVHLKVTPAVPLPSGGYRVRYTVAAQDGHTLDGVLHFGVQAPAPRTLPSKVASFRPPAALAITRAIDLAIGVVLFGGLLLRSPLAPAEGRGRRAFALLSGAWALSALASLAALVLTTPGLTGETARRLVTDSRAGRLSLVRALLAISVLVLLVGERAEGRLRIEPALVAALGCATYPLGGHATSTRGGILGTALAIAHVLAAGVWLGGLALVVGSRRLTDREYLRRALPFFGLVAAVSVGVLLATGTAVSVLRIGSLQALRSSDYGRTLLVKLALVAAVLAVAAVLRFRVVPRAVGESHRIPAGRGTLRLEMTIAVMVVVVSAVLASLPPPVLR